MAAHATSLLWQLPASEHVWWYLGRSSGFVSFWLLFLSVALGLAVSSRVADGVLARPWVFEMHKFLSVLVLIMMLFHGLIMLPDPYAGFRLRDLLIPMETSYRPIPVALGIVTLYASALVTASFYLKGMIGQRGWRALHYTTFALFVAALAHGAFAGTDGKHELVQFSYLAAGLSTLFLVFFRILASKASARRSRAAPVPIRQAA